MRVTGNEKPEQIIVERCYAQPEYSEIRIRENARKKSVSDENGTYNMWEYDEYVFQVPNREGIMEDVESNLAEWIETGRNLETDVNSTVTCEENERIQALVTEGAALAQASGTMPSATVGMLADGFPLWEPQREYAQYELFTHEGMVGFARQSFTSSEVYPPFSTGTEALYGVRPIPNRAGVYPYVCNMAASVGMLVSNEGITYKCIQPIDPMLFPPGDIPAHFTKES